MFDSTQQTQPEPSTGENSSFLSTSPSASPTARGLRTPPLIWKMPQVTQFRVLTFSKRICLSQWHDLVAAQQNSQRPSGKYQGPSGKYRQPSRKYRCPYPSHTCPSGSPGRGRQVYQRQTRRCSHIRPNFPVCSSSLAKKEGTTKRPGGRPAAPPAPRVLTPGRRQDEPGHLRGGRMCTYGAPVALLCSLTTRPWEGGSAGSHSSRKEAWLQTDSDRGSGPPRHCLLGPGF